MMDARCLVIAAVTWIATTVQSCDAATWTLYDGREISGEAVGFEVGECTVARYLGVIYVNSTEYRDLSADEKHVADTIALEAGKRNASSAARMGKGTPVSMVNPKVVLRNADNQEAAFSIYLFDKAGIQTLMPGFRLWYAKTVAELKQQQEAKKADKEALQAEADAAKIRCPICDKVVEPRFKYRNVDGRTMRLYQCPGGHEFLERGGPNGF